MRRLHHFALDPFSRKLRVLLREKNLAFDLIDERPGERRDELLHLNPSGEVPVLVDEHGAVVADSTARPLPVSRLRRLARRLEAFEGSKSMIRSPD